MPPTRAPHPLRPYGLAFLAFLAAASTVWGKVVYVDENAIGITQNGASWYTACLTVQAAIYSATSGDEVWVAKGTYLGASTLSPGVALYGGFAGTETDRSQRNWLANPTVLDGLGGDVVTSQYPAAVLDGFTVRSGRYGIHVSEGTATVSNCTFAGNSHGIYVYRGGATVTGCTAVGNTTYGIMVDSGGSAHVTNSTINGNPWVGIYVVSGGTVLVTNSSISAGFRGVDVYGGTAALSNSAISGNAWGAYVSNGGSANIANCTFSGNTSYGLYVGDATAGLTNCVVAFGETGIYRSAASVNVTFAQNNVYGNTTANYANTTDPTETNGNISVDPLFANRSGSNFHLQAGSPCVDAGDDSVVAAGQLDLGGSPRISGPHVDIGAYEYTGTAVPYTLAEAAAALKIAGGLMSVPASDLTRSNREPPSNRVDLADAVRIARKVAGLDPNP